MALAHRSSCVGLWYVTPGACTGRVFPSPAMCLQPWGHCGAVPALTLLSLCITIGTLLETGLLTLP